jgi:small subunit ribosomal protein S6
MKNYELTFIIDAQLAPEKQEEVITKFLDLLKSLNVEILNVEKWGKRKLAYAIGDRQYGYYLMTQFKATSNVLPQIDHHLKLSPFVFRHLLLYRDARTLKMMKLESERLAREAMYDAEKERVPAADADAEPDGDAAIESPAEEKERTPAADADTKPDGDAAIESPAEEKKRATAADADAKPGGDAAIESPAAEKERTPAVDANAEPDGDVTVESPAEEKKQAPAADADAKPNGDAAIESPAEEKERTPAVDADTKPDGDVTAESPADNTEEHQEEEGLEDTGPAEKE